MFETEGAPTPPQLLTSLLTLGTTDNYDNNPNNRDSWDSVHGFMVMLVQQPTPWNSGNTRSPKQYFAYPKSPKLGKLPIAYTQIKECRAVLGEKLAPAAPSNACILTDASLSDLPVTPIEAADWIASATKIMETKDKLDDGEALFWEAYIATHQPKPPARRPSSITAMLPVFKEKANTPTSMQHSMLLVKSAIDILNPGQTTCITGDQPLFETMKTIQWHSDTPHALKENNQWALYT